jgi:hypothetical protein
MQEHRICSLEAKHVTKDHSQLCRYSFCQKRIYVVCRRAYSDNLVTFIIINIVIVIIISYHRFPFPWYIFS